MEKDIESYLRKRVTAAGGLALKLVCPGFTGVPDRLILFPGGHVCFAELKDTGQKTAQAAAACTWLCCGILALQFMFPTARPPLTR